ncbi:phosphotransferase [Leucobacter luti]|uniref:phosphotransferase n=1 Tax=Leucobacter luti TaxID=340320 RepID=UPI003D065603
MQTISVSPDLAATALAETHGISATRLVPLGSELASTFRAETARGALAVKIQLSSPDEEPVQRWRADVAAALHELGHPVPAVVPARDGGSVAAVDVAGTPAAVLAIDWVEATPYAEATVSAGLGAELGGVAARLQRDLVGMPRPPREIAHTWAAHTTAATIEAHLRDHLGGGDGASPAARAARAIGERALWIHAERVAPHEAELPLALVHQDLHDSNVLVGEACAIRAIIDFDDMLVGWRVAEPAIAAAYFARHAEAAGLGSPAAAALEVLGGWEREHPMTAAEREAFLPIVAMRLALNTVVWAARAESDRGAYAAMRSRGSAATFERIAGELA